MAHFADRILEAIDRKAAPICVGIDPVIDQLPDVILDRHKADDAEGRSDLDAIFDFVAELLEVIAPHVPAVKFQWACFERYGPEGLEILGALVHEAASRELVVIADAKRGDIGISAAHYAQATLIDPPAGPEDQVASADAVTVSSYFGDDGLRPFLDLAALEAKGVFALVRTSNPGADALQQRELKDGGTVADAVAAFVAEIGDNPRYLGNGGYSLLGAVVAATRPQEAARLRRLMPRQLFLVPGFGAQGGSAGDVKPCFHEDGRGALVTASRSVIYAFRQKPEQDWRTAVEEAVIDMRKAVGSVLPM
ncbi:MAG: orotidine-5'-phosphate decarboxylase [Phycisphaerae bacterium]|nr:orotidine-5'-phosphate decarboxylase [Phycisphaerae bacterium]